MTKEEVLKELEEIAKEFNLPFDHHDVLTIWGRRHLPGMPKELADEIFPIYMSKLDKYPDSMFRSASQADSKS